MKSTTFARRDHSEFVSKSPTDIFKIFLDDNILYLILEESNKHSFAAVQVRKLF